MLGFGGGGSSQPPRVERVGSWDARVYAVEDVRVHLLKRLEHLSIEERMELQQSHSDFQALWSNPGKLKRELAEKEREEAERDAQDKEAGDDDADDDSPEARERRAREAAPTHRPSLDPPPPSRITFATYFHAGNQRAYRASEMEAMLDEARDAALHEQTGNNSSKPVTGKAPAAIAVEEQLELKDDEMDEETMHGRAQSANHDANAGDDEDDDKALAAAAANNADAAASSSSSAAPSQTPPSPSSSSSTSAPSSHQLHLGRPVIQQETRKKYSARLWMAEGFPLQMSLVVQVAELLFGSTYPQVVGKLRHFVNQRLPPGFPVRLHVPLLPVLSAEVSIRSFAEGAAVRYGAVGLDAEAERRAAQEYFSVPPSYAREELSEEEIHKRQLKYRKRWKATEASKKQAEQQGASSASGE